MKKPKMNNPNKNNIEKEKKIHPFLFLISLFLVGLVGTHFWNMWEEKIAKQELQGIIRSDDIELLLSGAAFSKDSNLTTVVNQLKEDIDILSTEELLQKQKETVQSPKEKDSVDNKNITASDALSNAASNTTDNVLENSQDIVNLALRNIVISQGENGIENWRLRAEWATLRQTSSVLNLNKPTLLYQTGDQISHSNKGDENDKQSNEINKTNIKPFKITNLQESSSKQDTEYLQKDFFKNSEDMLLITAENGLVFNNNTKIHLTKDVLAKQETNYIEGDTLNYDNTTRIATFPHSATFAGKNLKGNALVLDWDLNKNQILGTGKVEVTWLPNKKEKP